MSTSSHMSLALLWYSPPDLHASQASRRDHAGVDWAPGNDLLASSRQNG